MALTAGTRLGPYEIVGRLGAGGMGEVYRARDTKLDRDVAIKILTEAFVADAARVARFDREAKTLASLNHPNIATIYGLEEGGGATALVLELVEGPTLADRIALGPIPVDEALPIAKQIAEAIEAAHEQRIVHRDLKPANVKVRPDGRVKVLDFGLAKAMDRGPAGSASLSKLPTMTTPAMTQVGFIVGTAGYMSPEQARGMPADRRADIWAFGCVLVEMLTGKKAFEAADWSRTLAEVLTSEPDWKSLPPLPPPVEMVLRQCLKKDPRQRLRDIGDARLALEGAFDVGVPADSLDASPRSARGVWRWVLPAAALSSIAAVFVTRQFQPNPLPELVRFEIHAPPGSTLPPGTPAVSPDGRTLAYIVDGSTGIRLIHLRAIESTESRALPGTENAVHPFWSPDGRSLAFAAAGKLKRIDLAGGPVRELAPTTAPWHGSWNQFGELLFQAQEPFRIRAEGGTATPAIELDAKQGETGAGFPIFLADGRHFLVRVGHGDARSAIHLASLDSPDRKMILDNVFSAALVAPTPQGKTYLMYLRDAALIAHEFDERAGSVRGNPMVIVDGIARVANPAFMPALGVSTSGTMAYQTGGEYREIGLFWVDRSGTRLEELSPEASGVNPSLSPDGHRLAVDATARGNRDVWVTDLDRGATTRLTFADGADSNAVWSPDGGRVAFSRLSKIYVKRADGSSDEKVLAEVDGRPTSWSPDGNLLYGTSARKVFLVPLTGGQTPIAVGSRNGFSRHGQFSPDGRYIAYSSDESGRDEVYVQPLPPETEKWKVSLNGGDQPRWSRKSRELFFVSPDQTMMTVDVRVGQTFSAGVPRKLFLTGPAVANDVSYDVTADGQRFLINQRRATIPDTPITVVLNWWAELAKRQN